MLTLGANMPGEEIITDDFPAQVEVGPVKLEPNDTLNAQEAAQEVEVGPIKLEPNDTLNAQEAAQEETAAPVPLKLVEVATGIEVHCRPNVRVPDVMRESDPLKMDVITVKEEPSDDESPYLTVKWEPVESVTDENCTDENPYLTMKWEPGVSVTDGNCTDEVSLPDIKSEPVDSMDNDAEYSEMESMLNDEEEKELETYVRMSELADAGESSDGLVKREMEEEGERRLVQGKARRAKETPEERSQRLERIRDWWIRKKHGEVQLAKDSTETEEERVMRRINSERGRWKRESETTKEKKKRLAKMKAAQSKFLASETPEKKEERLLRMKLWHIKRMANETLEQREKRLKRSREYYLKRRSNKEREVVDEANDEVMDGEH